MEVLYILVYVVLCIVLLVSLGATLLGLPGNWLILTIVILLSIFTEFTIIPLSTMFILIGLILLGEAIEFALTLLGAQKYKPSKWSLVGAFLGSILGTLIGSSIIPLVGTLVGCALGVFVGAYSVELWMTGNQKQAERVARGALYGTLIGNGTKFLLALVVVFYTFLLIIRHGIS